MTSKQGCGGGTPTHGSEETPNTPGRAGRGQGKTRTRSYPANPEKANWPALLEVLGRISTTLIEIQDALALGELEREGPSSNACLQDIADGIDQLNATAARVEDTLNDIDHTADRIRDGGVPTW